MTSLYNHNAPASPATQSLPIWPPPSRSAHPTTARHTGATSGPGQTVYGWTNIPGEFLELLDDWDTACLRALAAAVERWERFRWTDCLQQLRTARRRLATRLNTSSPLSANSSGLTTTYWIAVPAELVDMLEDLDTACVIAASVTTTAAERSYWDARIEAQRSARQRLDAATPARSVPLVQR